MRGYAVGELSRALRTAVSHEDPATRSRADERAAAWTDVLQGMSSGQLHIGSRTPVGGLLQLLINVDSSDTPGRMPRPLMAVSQGSRS